MANFFKKNPGDAKQSIAVYCTLESRIPGRVTPKKILVG